VGWALGVGRVGAVLGPIVGGVLVGLHLPLAFIFGVYAFPLIAASVLSLRLRIQ
jgi:hypothetical protein